MPLRVNINNLNKKRKINRSLVRKKALRVLGSFRKKDALIDITFISDRKIKALNKKYMGRDAATDVISFAFPEVETQNFAPLPPEKGAVVGDIYISSDTARANARRFNADFEKEILLYAVHGVLHLLGFGDKTAGEKKCIRKLEQKFLK